MSGLGQEAPEQERRAPAAVSTPGPQSLATARAVGLVVALALAGGVLVPLVSDSAQLFTWTLVAVYMLFAASVNLLFGVSGVYSFGQAAVLGVGGYAVALAARDHGVEGLGALVLAGLGGAVVATVVALALWRVNKIGFAIVTLASAEILQRLTYTVPALAADDGIPGVRVGRVLLWDISSGHRAWWYVVAVVALGLAAMRWLERSSLGRRFRAVHDDRELAAAIGYPVTALLALSFVIAGFFGGVAGGLFVQVQRGATPELFHFSVSGIAVVMCLVGGVRWFAGPLVGALLYVWGVEIVSSGSSDATLFLGLVLLVVVLAAPTGLVGLLHRLASAIRGDRARTASP